MRCLQLVSVALLLAACGGTAKHRANGSSSGGAAGEPSAAAGTSNSPVAGAGGVAGSEAGGAGAGTGPGESGAGGQVVQACEGLDCLAGAQLVYLPNREWQRPADMAGVMDELSEADYQPLMGPTWLVEFSSDASSLQLRPMAGGATVHGTRDEAHADRAWFALDLFAGGRFVVQTSSDELQAEHTAYGSGSPIISSTRGLLQAQ